MNPLKSAIIHLLVFPFCMTSQCLAVVMTNYSFPFFLSSFLRASSILSLCVILSLPSCIDSFQRFSVIFPGIYRLLLVILLQTSHLFLNVYWQFIGIFAKTLVSMFDALYVDHFNYSRMFKITFFSIRQSYVKETHDEKN